MRYKGISTWLEGRTLALRRSIFREINWGFVREFARRQRSTIHWDWHTSSALERLYPTDMRAAIFLQFLSEGGFYSSIPEQISIAIIQDTTHKFILQQIWNVSTLRNLIKAPLLTIVLPATIQHTYAIKIGPVRSSLSPCTTQLQPSRPLLMPKWIGPTKVALWSANVPLLSHCTDLTNLRKNQLLG